MVDKDPPRPRIGQAAVGGTLPAKLVRDLPPHLDERDVHRRVTESIALFRASDSLFKKYMIYLRDQYQAKWEARLLDNLEGTLAAEIRAMETATLHRTMPDRAATAVTDAQLARRQKERELHVFETEAPHITQRALAEAEANAIEADNKLLDAKLKNEQLRRKLASAGEAREKVSDEQAAYERGRRQTRTQRAEQKGALDENEEWRQKARREFVEKRQAIRDDPALTPEEKTEAIDKLRTAYAKIFAHEY